MENKKERKTKEEIMLEKMEIIENVIGGIEDPKFIKNKYYIKLKKEFDIIKNDFFNNIENEEMFSFIKEYMNFLKTDMEIEIKEKFLELYTKIKEFYTKLEKKKDKKELIENLSNEIQIEEKFLGIKRIKKVRLIDIFDNEDELILVEKKERVKKKDPQIDLKKDEDNIITK